MDRKNKNYCSLEGKFLIASPNISDPRFSKTLIYMISDSYEGSMGVIVNKPAININPKDIFYNLKEYDLQKWVLIQPKTGQILPGASSKNQLRKERKKKFHKSGKFSIVGAPSSRKRPRSRASGTRRRRGARARTCAGRSTCEFRRKF